MSQEVQNYRGCSQGSSSSELREDLLLKNHHWALVDTRKPVMALLISEDCNKLPGAMLAAGCSPRQVNQTVKVTLAARGGIRL